MGLEGVAPGPGGPRRRLVRSYSCHQFEPGAPRGPGLGRLVPLRFTDEEVFMAPPPGPDYPASSKRG